MKCKYHNCQNEVIPSLKSSNPKLFCCSACKNKYNVDKKRLDIKFKAIQYKGGKCEICGFKGLPACFDFHHLVSSEKEFAISKEPHTRSWERTVVELDKCRLLCANCHREVEFKKTMDKKDFIQDLLEKYGQGDRT